MKLGELSRLIKIQNVLFQYRIYEIIGVSNIARITRILSYLFPHTWFNRKRGSRGIRLRYALEELGPIFIKFGQLLSTRRDLIPEDIILELIKLQDEVPTFHFKEVKRIVEDEFLQKIEALFLKFDEIPLASASIAQVHAATTRDGREIIVKVIRPNIAQIIRRDIGVMYFLARQLEHYLEDARNLCLINVVAEFEKVLLSELDLMREASNASQLRRNFMGSDSIYIPEVHWDMTRKNVMVMERVSGIRIDDIDALKAQGIDLKWLAKVGIEFFFTEVLKDSFFHADMHPGNIFVVPPKSGESAKIILVDFGIMSSLSESDQRYLAENFLAFLERDYRKVAQLHIECGWVPVNTRTDEFESSIRAVCEPLFDRPLNELSLGNLLLNLFRTAKQFGMEILPQLLLLQKTLINIEGLGRQLDPKLNILEAAKPIFDRWLQNRIGVKGVVNSVQDNLPRWLGYLPHLPNKAINIIDNLHNGNVKVETTVAELQAIKNQIARGNKQTVLATVGSAFIICAAIIFGLDGFSPAMLGGVPYFTWLFGGAGFVLLILSAK